MSLGNLEEWVWGMFVESLENWLFPCSPGSVEPSEYRLEGTGSVTGDEAFEVCFSGYVLGVTSAWT